MCSRAVCGCRVIVESVVGVKREELDRVEVWGMKEEQERREGRRAR